MTPLHARTVAALAGFAVMSLELAAVRLLAPHFGDSAFVWTNVIGVMLVALALGAWMGGRLADAERGTPRLAMMLLGAGVFAALIPVAAGPIARAMLPQDIALEGAMDVLVRGSLAATLLLFAPPVLIAGAVTPILVVALATDSGRVGRSSGLVATWSTLGSLAGTFATTHLLVPGIGSRATVWGCAGLLIGCSLLCRFRRAAVVVLLWPVGLALVPLGAMRTAPEGSELLAEVESAYQYLQVVRDPSEPATTSLKINEGLDSFHSVRIAGTSFTGGRYYDYHAVAPFLAGDGSRPPFLRVLSLGAAAGTFERIYAAAHEGVEVDSVELDPDVVRLGREHFGAFETPGRVFSGLDARVFVDHTRDRYHVVLVDAYERQIYIPAHVASRQFFESVFGVLEAGGIVSVNSGGNSFEDPVVQALASTMASVFGESHAFRVPSSRNFMIVARRDARIDPNVLQRVDVAAGNALGEIVAQARARGAWRRFEPGGIVLDDDRPLLDGLLEDALDPDTADPLAIACGGAVDPSVAERSCYQLALDSDWEGVVAAVAGASSATGYLRFVAGDARWYLHDVPGAREEYREAKRLGVDESLRAGLEQRLVNADAELARVIRGNDAARWNGISALAVLGVLAAVFLVAVRRLPAG